ncbi:virulence factor lipase N-terminal [Marinobacter antarcticus]|uniref:Virulence factor lipase N-terminal n=1 Tax=Marinobacter antarcticus TaxID=564117 RepID=A0A1M6VKL3_9GAMM|nr:hypothetical protein [Marinobacter antarcticus]SHK82042.1 virulence factor lipase N-terminal [Marinobacter antarcticus]
MFKKTLISLAVASSLGLTGCFDSAETGANANPDYIISNPAIDGKTWPIFNPVTSELPLPNDLIFKSDDPATAIIEADGTFSVADTSPPVTTALNSLSGASTVAPAVVRLNGQIDVDSVDSRPFIIVMTESGPVPAPNPNQNVFLIELEYASGDPVQGLGMGEPPTVPLAITAQVAAGALPLDLEGRDQAAAGAYLAGLAQNPTYTHEVVELDGTSAIRIHPTVPLDPKKRYLVVVTKEVTDINGDPIIASPTYSNLTDENQPLGTSSLAPVRTIINSFWETVAGSYFGVNNTTRPTPLTAEDIALSYSFTTSNDEEVLKYIADPTTYFRDTVAGAARVAGVKQALADGLSDFLDLLEAANTAEAASNPDDTAAALNAGLGALLPNPGDRSSSATFGAPQDVTQVSAITDQFVDFGDVNIVQGTIDLPYYLGVPTGQTEAEGAVINTSDFTADLVAASNIGDQLGVQLAQSDATVSDVVNYRFPFPGATSNALSIPVFILYPASYNGSTPLETVIYQHGITTDRSAALTFGSALAKNANVAVVAIDQPLHGVTPFSVEDQQALAGQLLTVGQAGGLPESLASNETNINAVIAGQIAIGFVLAAVEADAEAQPIDAATAAAVVADVATGGTISDLQGISIPDAALLDPAIRSLRSFENTVANAGSTVPGLAKTENERHFDFTAGAANQPVPMTATAGESGSLFINLTNFTNSRDKNRQAVLDLLNLRESLGGLDFDGTVGADLDATQVYFTGHSLGTIVGAPFVAVANNSAETADDIIATQLLTPGAGIVRLLENSPAFAPTILGGLQAAAGLEQGDADLETFFNIFQAALDSADPINFADDLATSKVVLSQVNGDQVIPNDPLANPLGQAFEAYLSGTEPFARLLGATPVTGDGVPVALDNAAITRYLEGTHSTPVLPLGGPLDERVFAEMVSETASLISAVGTAVVPNPAGLDPEITEIIQQD